MVSGLLYVGRLVSRGPVGNCKKQMQPTLVQHTYTECRLMLALRDGVERVRTASAHAWREVPVDSPAVGEHVTRLHHGTWRPPKTCNYHLLMHRQGGMLAVACTLCV